ncbi:MAG: hypothetical protein A3I29_00415 [Candidatus Magasanikbacteria bacterium RIFCSPLOWO2_02_FULL_44_11]|uniref:Uncharacterized protein n=1 Tax=Candidatus Magasanikbacteria bacterium RIFCSPLOWO2_02_FULL_44_11 TaxID=1798689 RepID=A0A1F6N9G9_9BACT|nr:MAG: hypothetical protein A3I29_00415 [Candidatus Magasanikbacteria bacterium RIFCSPLOWO2_02_FULL_44_11]
MKKDPEFDSTDSNKKNSLKKLLYRYHEFIARETYVSRALWRASWWHAPMGFLYGQGNGSQGFPGVLSQSAYPALHCIEQMPPSQTLKPKPFLRGNRLHSTPQSPQFQVLSLTLVRQSTSPPSEII